MHPDHFKFSIGPTRDFDNLIQDGLFGTSKKRERDMMKRRNGNTILFYVCTLNSLSPNPF